ncbi:hypothetical protein GGD50_005988 [Rhizobium paranaense]|uniref:Uncharacterized protein n=1 Tax=Rhizobium paranaense TaxID=1650438 RepID=A0A7W8XXH9_9HYPH|nr:hypothetical protein [Rhizobium paranaense]
MTTITDRAALVVDVSVDRGMSGMPWNVESSLCAPLAPMRLERPAASRTIDTES